MDHNSSAIDSPLLSTVEDITADCPQFRILVVGKTGCGKSSLINKVFGVEKAQVAHDAPGKANIDVGLCPSDNDRFILHDSEGFEPAEDVKFNTVKRFIEDRSKVPLPKDKLHAIWICVSVPVANDRVVETGIERIVKMQRGNVPLIVVFTKYDMLVTSEIRRGARGGSTEQVYLNAEEKASKAFERLCSGPLTEAIGEMRIRRVSGQARYDFTIKELIQATDEEIQRHTGISSHTEPHSVNFAAAQRANPGLKVKTSIDVGQLKYWRGLLSRTDFTGKKLQQCLDVIHRDIVSIWNIRNSSYLADDNFKEKMIVLVDDLAANPITPTPSDGLTMTTVAALAGAASSTAGIVILFAGAAIVFGKWIFDVYRNTSNNIACVMAYIVDLTILMHRLSAIEISEESVILALQNYAKSGEIAQVHNDIRTFCGRFPIPHSMDEDDTLNEIICLIKMHHVEVPET